MSRPFHRLFQRRRPTLHIAHRGGAALAPENTLAAFGQAVSRWRTDMLELDVHFSKDGEAWVSHDPTVDRCTDGKGAIAELTSAELKQLDAGFRFSTDGRTFPFRGQGLRLPRLLDVAQSLPHVLLNIDLKSGPPDAFARAVRAADLLDRACLGAESDAAASELSTLLPGACLFLPREALTTLVMSIRGGAEPVVDDRFHVLDMPLTFQGVRLVDDVLLRATDAAGLWVNVWTIDDETQMKNLVKDGVGGIMTDRPDLLRQVLDA